MSERKALQVLMKSPISHEMVSHVVNTTLKVIQCKKSKTISLPSPPSSPSKSLTTIPLPSLMTFITRLIRYTNIYTGTFLTTLVYLQRITARLPKNSEGSPCTLHRIFLACLILSSKFHNDSSPKNGIWAKYTDGLFQAEDINLMERQLLTLLDWDLNVTPDELVKVLRRFIEPIKMDIEHAAFTKRVVSEHARQQQQQQAQRQQNTQLLSPLKSPVRSSTRRPSLRQIYPCPKMSSKPLAPLPVLPQTQPPALVHSRSSSTSSVSSNQSCLSRSSTSSSLSSPYSDDSWEQRSFNSPVRISSGKGTDFQKPQELSLPHIDGSLKLQQLPQYSFKFNAEDLNRVGMV